MSSPRIAPLLSVGFVLAVLLIAGCRPQPTEWPEPAETAVEVGAGVGGPVLRLVDPAELPPLLDDGESESLREAAARSRRWYARRPASRSYTVGEREVTAREMVRALDLFLSWLDQGLSGEALAAEIVRAFDVYESIGGPSGRMLVTGYFEPVIEGSLRRTTDYRVPLYRPPGGAIRVDLGLFDPDLEGEKILGRLEGGRLVPFPSRGEMRSSGLYRGREIVWLRDPIDGFFLEIQGSGSVRLPDGREIRIGYAGANGRPYRSIGRLLIDEGEIEREKVSMQSIRAWLEQHPQERDRVFDHNESVVFFRRLEGAPVGSLGFPVTAGRTVATDRSLFPHGALGYLVSEVPAMGPGGETVAEGPLGRYVLNQDTGGAIRGPGRVDFFWGRGEDAGHRAGLMKQPGRLLFFAPKAR